MQSVSIVIGLGYGDEGKGLTTSYLVSQASHRPLVIRFNGGHQAGHTVVLGDKRHIFSSFGSGTLQGVDTFLSRFCTFSPGAVRNEYESLIGMGLKPILYVDPLSPVTTPYDIQANQSREKQVKHGSVGVGFGTTIQRQESFHKIHFMDLFYYDVLRFKLDLLQDHYPWLQIDSDVIYHFLEDVKWLIECGAITQKAAPVSIYTDIIMEGAQGVLLDMDMGFFPHVTRSNTTSKNAIQLCKEYGLRIPEIYYVTRTYQTRHGNGPMSTESYPVKLENNEGESNKSCPYQGEFRTGRMDLDMLRYSMACDSLFSAPYKKHLMMTCLDQTGEKIKFMDRGMKKIAFAKEIASDLIGISQVYYSTSPDSNKGIETDL